MNDIKKQVGMIKNKEVQPFKVFEEKKKERERERERMLSTTIRNVAKQFLPAFLQEITVFSVLTVKEKRRKRKDSNLFSLIECFYIIMRASIFPSKNKLISIM